MKTTQRKSFWFIEYPIHWITQLNTEGHYEFNVTFLCHFKMNKFIIIMKI